MSHLGLPVFDEVGLDHLNVDALPEEGGEGAETGAEGAEGQGGDIGDGDGEGDGRLGRGDGRSRTDARLLVYILTYNVHHATQPCSHTFFSTCFHFVSPPLAMRTYTYRYIACPHHPCPLPSPPPVPPSPSPDSDPDAQGRRDPEDAAREGITGEGQWGCGGGDMDDDK